LVGADEEAAVPENPGGGASGSGGFMP